jgi:hypothetical protein
MMGCMSSRVISQPVLIPKVDRSFLVSCGELEAIDNSSPVLSFKNWIDLFVECSNKQKVLADYIRVIE